MSFTIENGLTYSKEFKVLPEHSAAHLGSGSVNVLSTPSMILFMEMSARTMMDEVLPDPFSTVGIHVNVSHKKAVKVGEIVKATVTLTNQDRKKLYIDVKVEYKDEIVGEGKHERFIIDKVKFLQTL